MRIVQTVLRILSANTTAASDQNHHPTLTDDQWTLYICVVVGLVLLAGLMSGLTLGLMSINVLDMEVLRRTGTPKEKLWAKRIDPSGSALPQVLSHPHFLLVTLVLCNAAATEALPIFLDRLVDPVTAVLISITVVLIFGEIIPQAVCSRYGLQVGAYSAWFVRALMVVCAVIAWPISKLLDALLGHDQEAIFRRAQLKAVMDIHAIESGLGGDLSEDEITVIRGALDLSNKTAVQCMTPIDKVFMLSTDAVLNEATLLSILESGHSRIPVHKPDSRRELVGIVLVKELILIDKAAAVRVGDLKMRSAPQLNSETRLYDMLRLFETGRCHMAVLAQNPGTPLPGTKGHPSTPSARDGHAHNGDMGTSDFHDGIHAPSSTCENSVGLQERHPSMVMPGAESIGIITIEDVIEELLQQEIVDETDRYIDNLRLQRVNAALLTSNLPRHLRNLARQQITRIGHLAQLRGGQITRPHLPTSPGTAHADMPSDDIESDVHITLLPDGARPQH